MAVLNNIIPMLLGLWGWCWNICKNMFRIITYPFAAFYRIANAAIKSKLAFNDFLNRLNEEHSSQGNYLISAEQREDLENIESLKNANLSRFLSIIIYLVCVIAAGLTLWAWLMPVSQAEITAKLNLNGIYFRTFNAPKLDSAFHSRSRLKIVNARFNGGVFDLEARAGDNGNVKLNLLSLKPKAEYRLFYDNEKTLTTRISSFSWKDPAQGSISGYQEIKFKSLGDGEQGEISYKILGHPFSFTHHTQNLVVNNFSPVEWTTDEFLVDSIALVKPKDFTLTGFSSSVVNGSIEFNDAEKKRIVLTGLDSVTLKISGHASLKLVCKNGLMYAEIKGKVFDLGKYSVFERGEYFSIIPKVGDRWRNKVPDYVFQSIGTLIFTFLTFLIFRQRKAI